MSQLKPLFAGSNLLESPGVSLLSLASTRISLIRSVITHTGNPWSGIRAGDLQVGQSSCPISPAIPSVDEKEIFQHLTMK